MICRHGGKLIDIGQDHIAAADEKLNILLHGAPKEKFHDRRGIQFVVTGKNQQPLQRVIYL